MTQDMSLTAQSTVGRPTIVLDNWTVLFKGLYMSECSNTLIGPVLLLKTEN